MTRSTGRRVLRDSFAREAARRRVDYRFASGPRRRLSIGLSRLRARRTVAIIALAAFLLIGTRQAFTVPFTGLGLSPAQLILFVLVALWVITRVLGQRAPAGLGLLSAIVIVRLMVTLVSYGLGWARALTVAQRTATNTTIVTEFVAAGIVMVFATLLRTRRDIELVMRALVVGGTFSALFALIQYATGVDIAARVRLPGLHEVAAPPAVALLREGLVRAQGSAAAPLELGGVMTVLVPVAIGLFFAARRRDEHGWPWAVAGVLMTAGAVVSLSRSVILGIGLALVVMSTRWPLRRTLAVLSSVVVVALAALASGAKVVSAIVTVLTKGSNDYSLQSRSNGREYVLRHFTDHLWFGQGPGTYDLTTQPVLDNQYLSQLIESGVLGLIFLVLLLLCALSYALRATSRRAPADAIELAVGLAGAISAVLVVDAVLDTEGFMQVFALIWLLIALTGAIWRLIPPPSPTRISRASV